MILTESDHKVHVDVHVADTVAQNLVSFVTAGEELVEHTKREDGVDSPSMQTTMQKANQMPTSRLYLESMRFSFNQCDQMQQAPARMCEDLLQRICDGTQAMDVLLLTDLGSDGTPSLALPR